MKDLRLCLFIVLLNVSSFSLFGQDNHITFKGIPVDGTIKEFTVIMENNGFSFITESDRTLQAGFMGKFSGEECIITAAFTPASKTVWSVSAHFPEDDSWYYLSTKYDRFKSLMEEKYGKPDTDFHFFSRPYKDMDGHELDALYEKKCHYHCSFKVDNGTVMLSLESVHYGKGNLCVSYEDNANVALKHQEENAQMNQDL